jgi:hypothetical protein
MATQQQLQSDPAALHAMLVVELDAQCSRFGELDALSQRQSALVERDDGTELLMLLAERQAVIDEIARLSARIDPLRKAWDEVAAHATAALRTDIETRINSMAALLHGIRERDEFDRTRLETRRESIRREMIQMNASKQAVGAYGNKAAGPNYQDRTA